MEAIVTEVTEVAPNVVNVYLHNYSQQLGTARTHAQSLYICLFYFGLQLSSLVL
jgi:hypothetical protein